jgi:hypothetical protein
VVVILSLPLLAIALLLWSIGALVLLSIVWLTWCRRGRYAMVVYSNSPVWQEYFESRVLPELGDRAVVLNWSERKSWARSMPVMLFHMFAGSDEFNPLALVFEPFTWPRRFRFYHAFRSYKRGRPEEVEAVRLGFLAALDALAPPSGPGSPQQTISQR